MLDHNDHEYEHNPFTGFSPRMAKHLQSEVHTDLTELNEMYHDIHQIKNKTHSRTKRIRLHMQHCGECLSEQIKTGMLIQLSEYWDMRKKAGDGQYPKLHYQVN